jgi:hypothetical protein
MLTRDEVSGFFWLLLRKRLDRDEKNRTSVCLQPLPQVSCKFAACFVARVYLFVVVVKSSRCVRAPIEWQNVRSCQILFAGNADLLRQLDLNALPPGIRAEVVKLIGEGIAKLDAAPGATLSSTGNLSFSFSKFAQFHLSGQLTLSELGARVSSIIGVLRVEKLEMAGIARHSLSKCPLIHASVQILTRLYLSSSDPCICPNLTRVVFLFF